MNDLNRDKRDLVNELANLRKQIADLKQAAVEHRRVADGLRREEELLRTLIEGAPVRLCLLGPGGEPMLASQSFARLLGYGSSGELVRLTRELGQTLPGSPDADDAAPVPMALKRKDGSDVTVTGIRAAGGGGGPVVLAVLEES